MLPSLSQALFCGPLCLQLLPLEEDLRRCRREQQEAQLRGRQLEQRVEEVEERSAATVGERERQVKLMEVDVSGNTGVLFVFVWGGSGGGVHNFP